MKRVYFLRRASGEGPVKIGVSDWPEARRTQIGWSLKTELKILAEAPAPNGFRDEARLHREMAAHRLHGEWFDAAAPVLDLVAFVEKRGALPPPSEIDREQAMARYYLAGACYRQIGERFGVSRERVRQILRALNVPSLGSRPHLWVDALPPLPEHLELLKDVRDFCKHHGLWSHHIAQQATGSTEFLSDILKGRAPDPAASSLMRSFMASYPRTTRRAA